MEKMLVVYLHASLSRTYVIIIAVFCLLSRSNVKSVHSGLGIFAGNGLGILPRIRKNKQLLSEECSQNKKNDKGVPRNSERIFFGNQPINFLLTAHSQSKLSFINSIRYQSEIASEIVEKSRICAGYLCERAREVTDSPSFPHFIAGIAAG